MSNEARLKLGREATARAKGILKVGDRVGATACPGTKRTFTFDGWFGQWMVSKTQLEYHPLSVYAVNGRPVDFKLEQTE